ncbi:MAG: hypothetical protein K2Q10_13405, partial [Rhodospirillales bacterium]|nr:hypothetical protein [Rhodospirillales bacterium]
AAAEVAEAIGWPLSAAQAWADLARARLQAGDRPGARSALAAAVAAVKEEHDSDLADEAASGLIPLIAEMNERERAIALIDEAMFFHIATDALAELAADSAQAGDRKGAEHLAALAQAKAYKAVEAGMWGDQALLRAAEAWFAAGKSKTAEALLARTQNAGGRAALEEGARERLARAERRATARKRGGQDRTEQVVVVLDRAIALAQWGESDAAAHVYAQALLAAGAPGINLAAIGRAIVDTLEEM